MFENLQLSQTQLNKLLTEQFKGKDATYYPIMDVVNFIKSLVPEEYRRYINYRRDGRSKRAASIYYQGYPFGYIEIKTIKVIPAGYHYAKYEFKSVSVRIGPFNKTFADSFQYAISRAEEKDQQEKNDLRDLSDFVKFTMANTKYTKKEDVYRICELVSKFAYKLDEEGNIRED